MGVGDATALIISDINAKSSAVFDGVDDYVQTSSNPLSGITNKPLSLNVWFLALENASNAIILGLGENKVGVTDQFLDIGVTSAGVLRCQAYFSSGNEIILQEGDLNMNEWNMLTFIRDGNTWRPYLNSVAQTTGSKSGSFGTLFNNGYLTLGNTTHASKTSCCHGVVSKAGVWNKALTQSEIDDLYAGADVQENFKVAQYKLANNYEDSVGSNDGTNSGSRLAIIDDEISKQISDMRNSANDKWMMTSIENQIIAVNIEEAA